MYIHDDTHLYEAETWYILMNEFEATFFYWKARHSMWLHLFLAAEAGEI